MSDKWDQRYLRVARHVASWSLDPSTKCGAVLVRPNKTLASLGFNGFPQGVADSADLYDDRQTKYARIVHSEMNALLFSQDQSLAGYQVFAWPMPPCDRCTAHLIQEGVARMVCPPPSQEKLDRWKQQFDIAHDSWIASGAQVDYRSLEGDFPDDRPPSLDLLFADDTPKWDGRFLRLAAELASWSRDPIDPRGAVLVRPDKTVASIGFNGFPQSLPDDPTRYRDPAIRASLLIDAELNAMIFARDRNLEGYRMYAWPTAPCERTVSHLVQKRLGRIIVPTTLSTEAQQIWTGGDRQLSIVLPRAA